MKNKNGFTLIELTIVTAVIALLVSVLLAKAEQSLRKATESAAKANLGIMRVAIMNYYASNEGQWPSFPLSGDLTPHHINVIPVISLDQHSAGRNVVNSTITDSGGWSYFPETGNIYINCTHTDLNNEKFSDW